MIFRKLPELNELWSRDIERFTVEKKVHWQFQLDPMLILLRPVLEIDVGLHMHLSAYVDLNF
jgi:hypothetical protein